jgi:hypothetical protein
MPALKGLNPYRTKATSTAAAVAPVVARGGYVITASGAPADQEFRSLDGQRMFDNNGETNAWDKKDAARKLRHFAAKASSGELRREGLESFVPKNERHQVLVAAYHDQSGEKWAALGAGVVQLIEERQQREGLVRKLLNVNPLNVGEEPKINMTKKVAEAVIATSEASVEYQVVRNNRVYPTELSLVANLRVSNLDLQQASGDHLEEMYNQGYEAILVREDRLWKMAADKLADTGVNPTILLGTPLTPALLSQIKNQLTGQGLPVGAMVMASDFWDDMLGNPGFYDLYDPVTRYNLIQDGTIGTIFGMPIITDSFRDPDFRVLNIGEMYVTAAAEFSGGYTDRGGIEATAVDGAQTGSDSKGWFLRESFSLGLINPKSIVRVRR